MSERLQIALPVDVSRLFDNTVTQTQLTNNTFQGSADDRDTLASYIEDAADEFRALAGDSFRISRVGVGDSRETFEHATYKISGHQLTKGTFSGTWTRYLPDESEIMLEHERILPFDSAQGDAVYLYQGLAESGSSWKDVTSEEADMWELLNPRTGRFVFSPIAVAEDILTGRPTSRGTVPEFIKRIRFAISYRYGGLGGSRGHATTTDLDESLTSSQTGTVDVADGTAFPVGQNGGSIIILIGSEYLEVLPDPGNDQMEILARGVRGTSTASHSDGDTLSYTPPAIRKAVASRAAMALVDSGRYAAFLPDSEDAVDKSEMKDDFQATWSRTVEALT